MTATNPESSISSAPAAGETTPLDRRHILWASLLALPPYLWLVARFNWVCDDAFISFRYSANLAAGHGLRYNLGTDPPVEGFSNLLWVLLLAPFEALGVSSVGPSQVLAVACGLLLMWRVVRFLRLRLELPLLPLALSALAFATLPPLAVWSTSGLATLPFALLFFLAFEFLLGDPSRIRPVLAGMACAGLVLIRAEGFAWAGLLLALATGIVLLRRDKEAIKPLTTCTLIAAGVTLALFAFRLAYFKALLPNTVYAKVGISALTLERGFNYAVSFILAFPHLALIFVGGLVIARVDRSGRWPLLQAAVLSLAFVAYAVLVGGDFMAMGRFFVPAMPFFVILLAALIRRTPPAPAAGVALGFAAIALSLLPAFDIHVVPHDTRARFHFRWNSKVFHSEFTQWALMRERVADWATLGQALARYTQPGESLPSGAIGAIGYYSGLFIYDGSGLVNAEVARLEMPRQRLSAAHDKTVPPAFFLKYEPTYYLATIVESPSEDQVRQNAEAFILQRAPEPVRANYGARVIPLAPDSPGPESGAEKKYLLLIQRQRSSPA
jgi:hypothetical protein